MSKRGKYSVEFKEQVAEGDHCPNECYWYNRQFAI